MSDNKSIYPFYPWNYKTVVAADAVCAVIRGESRLGFSGHCGYCLFESHEVPVEWHGDYAADGLRFLNVHGGITYCEVEGGDMVARDAALKTLFAEKDARYKAQKESGEEFVSLWGEYHDRGKQLRREFGYTHVVFGFDTAHYGDDENHDLFDREHVFRLAHQMRSQIAEHARRIIEYRDSGRDRQIAILDEIRTLGDIKNDVSAFGLAAFAAKAVTP